ncbi:MAG: S26 family signal peptidase [Alphaproteobacteria bacterium]|nr:S26 family signal peptidase [Alphaproteobacteria bacterium]
MAWAARPRIPTLGLAAIAVAILVAADPHRAPRLVWNASPSVPVGLYWIVNRSPRVGTVAAVRLPANIAALAHARGYLARNAILLKPVVATHGSRVCRWANVVLFDGRHRAHAKSHDAAARPLPRWDGCVTLGASDHFLLSTAPGSFDGRYFGVLRGDAAIGQAIPLWTLQP